MKEGFDDFTRVRELLGPGDRSGQWLVYAARRRIKAMLALAGGDLERALIWTGMDVSSIRRSLVRHAQTNTVACKLCCSCRRRCASCCNISMLL